MHRLRTLALSLALLAMALPSMAATYSRPLTASFGTANTGKSANMQYKVLDTSGSTLIAQTNTGVSESPAGSGIYQVIATWDDTWAGAVVQWIDTTDSLYASATVAPTIMTATNQTTLNATNTRVTLALPAVAPAASGGLPTFGTGAGQINPDGTGALPVSSGTGTGQISLSAGKVLLQSTQTGVTIPTVTTVTNGVTVTTNNDKTGYTASTVSDKTGYSLSGSQTFSTTGAVGSVTGTVGSVTGAVGSVTGNVGGSVASVTAPVTIGTNNDKTGYALTVAPPTLAQIFGYAPDGSVTTGGILTILLANMAGSFTNTWNSGTHTLTTVYKRQDGTTTAYTNTTVNGSTSTAPAATSRTGAVGTLP